MTREEHYFFSGDEAMNTTLAAVAASDQSSNYDKSALGGKYSAGVVRLTLPTDCGFKASPNQKQQNLIYIQGTDNYDGLREILAATATTIDIIAPYVAETTSTDDVVRPGLKFDERWEFCGFKLHLDATSATSENLVISVDADRGAAWDYNIFTEDMNGVQDRMEKYADGEWIIQPNDILYVTWTNSDDTLWGLELVAKRVA
jgi:hypothetical protein